MIEIRATAPDEWRAAAAVVTNALMHAPPTDEDWETSLPSWADSDSISAWDRGRCVGHMSTYRFDTLVPGGARLSTAGVTRVGVLSTHRRQGLGRRLMERLIVDAHARGQVLASLRASEAVIYPRFGFGLAGTAAEVTVTPERMLPLMHVDRNGSLRLLAPDEILTVVPPIYERVAARTGAITRPPWMWNRYLKNAVALGGDAEYVVVHTSADGVDDGFVHYKVEWKHGPYVIPEGRGELHDLWGADPAVELALWDYLCNVDLVREWYCEERPTDEVVALAARDTRAYRSSWHWDEQWLRLLDVDAALIGRSYNDVAGAVTIAVHDHLLPANEGVWEISAAGAKRGTTEAADAELALDVRELAATYLGGVRWSALAAAGRIDARNPAALPVADRLFASTPAPFCGSGF